MIEVKGAAALDRSIRDSHWVSRRERITPHEMRRLKTNTQNIAFVFLNTDISIEHIYLTFLKCCNSLTKNLYEKKWLPHEKIYTKRWEENGYYCHVAQKDRSTRMCLTMNERSAIISELAPRYQHARKRERTQILNEFIQLTGLNRSYASFALKNYGRRKSIVVNGQRTVIVIGRRRGEKRQRKRARCYDQAVSDVLVRLWALSNGLCGKRLAVFIRESLPILERFKELSLDEPVRKKLLAISPATIDRLLAPIKAQSRLKGRSQTKSGTLLKQHIPIRTFADWNESVPGFVEIDLVGHEGGIACGDYAQSLNVTDIATGWTEVRAVKNKAQCFVFEALKDIRRSLPFPLLGIDSDNGGEFINTQLLRYCAKEQISFTRSRPLRKNDNCYVEQKNYSVVRAMVGYYRYDQPEQLALLNEIYQVLRLYTNFFQLPALSNN